MSSFAVWSDVSSGSRLPGSALIDVVKVPPSAYLTLLPSGVFDDVQPATSTGARTNVASRLAALIVVRLPFRTAGAEAPVRSLRGVWQVRRRRPRGRT